MINYLPRRDRYWTQPLDHHDHLPRTPRDLPHILHLLLDHPAELARSQLCVRGSCPSGVSRRNKNGECIRPRVLWRSPSKGFSNIELQMPTGGLITGPQTRPRAHNSLSPQRIRVHALRHAEEKIRSTHRHADTYSRVLDEPVETARGGAARRPNGFAAKFSCSSAPLGRGRVDSRWPPTAALYLRRHLWCRMLRAQSFGRWEPVSCGEAVKGLLPWRPS